MTDNSPDLFGMGLTTEVLHHGHFPGTWLVAWHTSQHHLATHLLTWHYSALYSSLYIWGQTASFRTNFSIHKHISPVFSQDSGPFEIRCGYVNYFLSSYNKHTSFEVTKQLSSLIKSCIHCSISIYILLIKYNVYICSIQKKKNK